MVLTSAFISEGAPEDISKLAGNFQKRLQRLEQLVAEIAKPNSQAKCNCRQFTIAPSAEYFAAEMNQTCPVHGFRQLGKIQIYRVTTRPNSVEETSLGIRDVVKEYQRRLAHHREEMLKRIQEEDDTAES